jgi:O-antigen/teichoic acid export membrane protein
VLITPVLLLFSPAMALALPKIAADLRAGAARQAERRAQHLTLTMTAGAACYAVLAYLFSTPLEHLAYGGKYDDAAWLIGPLSLSGVIAASTLGPYVSMRAAAWPQCSAFIAAGSLAAAIVFVPVIVRFDLAGAAAASLAIAVAGAVTTIGVQRYFRRSRRTVAPD